MAIKKNVEKKEEPVIVDQEVKTNDYEATVLLNFRSKPSMEGKVKKVLPIGTVIKVEKITDGWAKGFVGDDIGYVMEAYITAK